MMYAGPYAESNHRKIKHFWRTLVREFRRPMLAGHLAWLKNDPEPKGLATAEYRWFFELLDQPTAR